MMDTPLFASVPEPHPQRPALPEPGLERWQPLRVGLSAAAARAQVDCWYFIIDAAADAPRINADLWLTSEQRVVLTRERLREALQGRGQVYDTARGYRRAVDERLFRLGPQRYDALMDTLIQLRQPQLSKKPDEAALSNALSEALPPLGPELIADVAETLGQLEEDRRQLDEYQALAKAVGRFEQRYRVYAGTRGRREAGALRSAQTEFDNASRARNEAEAVLEAAVVAEADARSECEQAELALTRERVRLETLRADPRNQDANRLENAGQDAEARRRAEEATAVSAEKARLRAGREAEESRRQAGRSAEIEALLAALRRESATYAAAAGIGAAYATNPLTSLGADALAALTAPPFEQARSALRALGVGRRDDIVLVRQRLAAVARADAALTQRRETREERLAGLEEAVARRERADTGGSNALRPPACCRPPGPRRRCRTWAPTGLSILP
jgi:hypothetical protein